MDPLNLTWIEFLQLLHKYIDNIGQSARWLPIVAFVYSGIEWKDLIKFWIDKEDHRKQELWRQQDNQSILAMNKRRLISVILLGLLSGAFFTSLVLTHKSAAAISRPLE